MKVLHVIWRPEIGGIEKLVFDLLGVQNQLQPDSTNVFFGRPHGALSDGFRNAGFRCYSSEFRNGFDINPGRIKSARAIFDQHEIVHLHGFDLPIAAACLKTRAKLIYTEHGNFGFGRRWRLRDRLKHILARQFFQSKIDYLTFNSQFTRNVWEERFKLNVPRAVVLNGISFEDRGIDSARPQTPELGDSFIIGTSSRFAGFKRIDRLIRAFAQFQTGKDTRLLLVGDGPIRADLEALVAQLGISEKTIFTGFKPAVRGYQALMDVCVFPSQSEPFGLVAIETLSLGKPTVVFSDGGGMADIVRPLCASDVVSDETALTKRLTDYFERRSLPDNDKDRRIKHAHSFDIKTTAMEFEGIYRDVLGLGNLSTERACLEPRFC